MTEFQPQRAEAVTELYFENHTQLPQQYRAGETHQYEVLQQDGAGDNSHILKTGTVNLQGNGSQTEVVNIRYIDTGNTAAIVIRLINENQLIRYRVNAL